MLHFLHDYTKPAVKCTRRNPANPESSGVPVHDTNEGSLLIFARDFVAMYSPASRKCRPDKESRRWNRPGSTDTSDTPRAWSCSPDKRNRLSRSRTPPSPLKGCTFPDHIPRGMRIPQGNTCLGGTRIQLRHPQAVGIRHPVVLFLKDSESNRFPTLAACKVGER